MSVMLQPAHRIVVHTPNGGRQHRHVTTDPDEAIRVRRALAVTEPGAHVTIEPVPGRPTAHVVRTCDLCGAHLDPMLDDQCCDVMDGVATDLAWPDRQAVIVFRVPRGPQL